MNDIRGVGYLVTITLIGGVYSTVDPCSSRAELDNSAVGFRMMFPASDMAVLQSLLVKRKERTSSGLVSFMRQFQSSLLRQLIESFANLRTIVVTIGTRIHLSASSPHLSYPNSIHA